MYEERLRYFEYDRLWENVPPALKKRLLVSMLFPLATYGHTVLTLQHRPRPTPSRYSSINAKSGLIRNRQGMEILGGDWSEDPRSSGYSSPRTEEGLHRDRARNTASSSSNPTTIKGSRE